LILLADDEAVARRLVGVALERAGFRVLEAADGEAALRLVQSDNPDLLVLDFEMPHLNGAEVCHRLRHSDSEAARALPVIMLTAHTGEEEEIGCLQAGANDFVTKPVSRDVLAARIRTQLRLRMMGDALRAQNEELATWRSAHQADLAAAHATQQVLIPAKLPTLRGWEFESIYQPVIEIGGDVFGWCRAGQGSRFFWLADATGHGAAAALVTALAAQLFGQACEAEDKPGAILRAVNLEFRKLFGGRVFMTACCARVEQDGRLSYAGAGHPPLFIRRKDGSVEAIDSHWTVLGLKETEQIEQSRTKLSPGDMALLYSDGVFAFKEPGGERFTHENLRQVLRDIAPGPAYFQRVLAALGKNSNGEACSDDIAAMALQRLA
jgi:sigma-B regulation protein RsbU (phosphoserine phosphatase)